ncbi:unnamed protein product [Oikopleura dioica]|uniref:Uncharacterized protein n=2 Tax=Oikopleura dioica TaxID=34765 RepID=E4Z6D6_OIKDI|nr:unnamed protein product [Oikopleura dioica]
MPFDFATSILFDDEIFEAQPSDSEIYQIEMNIPFSAFEIEQTTGSISYGGKVEGAAGLLTDESGLLILGSSISTSFTCVYSDSYSVGTSTSVNAGVRGSDVSLGAISYAGDLVFELESSVDPDSPPKIGDTITLAVRPNTGFTENDPIVYYISKITASDPDDETVSAIIYMNPCAFSFIEMEFSHSAESTDLSQAQSFSLRSFVFPGSIGVDFEIEIKLCVLDGNGVPLDQQCSFNDVCSLPYSNVAPEEL